MSTNQSLLLWGLFLLRFGLGFFLCLWAIDKIVAPDSTVKIFSHFYFLSINTSIAMLLGSVELVLGLMIVLGMYKTISYGSGLLLHTISTLSTYDQLLNPFGKNHLFIAAIPIFFSFVTLFLLRDRDTKFSLTKRKSIFS